MQISLSLDLSTLKPHQREAFLVLVNSFSEPTSDETPVVTKRRRKSTVEAATPPAASGVLEAGYFNLVQYVTSRITDGRLNKEQLQVALDEHGVKTLPDLSEQLELVLPVWNTLEALLS